MPLNCRISYSTCKNFILFQYESHDKQLMLEIRLNITLHYTTFVSALLKSNLNYQISNYDPTEIYFEAALNKLKNTVNEQYIPSLYVETNK